MSYKSSRSIRNRKEMFPIVEGSEDRLICGMKLGPYLTRSLKETYIFQKNII